MKSGTNTIATYAYDVAGNRTSQTNGNGTSTTYAYDTDPRYRLNSIAHKRETATLATISYTSTARDNAGNPKVMTDWTGTWSYGYDCNQRLTSAVPPNPVPEQPAGGTYNYDWVGNRLNPPANPNPMTYNAADQLTSWPGMYSYTYYGDGSLHEIKNPGGTSTLKSFTYTPDGLMSIATYNGRTLSNTWDADSNRVKLDANGSEYDFVYDTTAGNPAVIE